MGCVKNISYDKFPKQSNSKLFKIGSRVEVCYHYDTSKRHYGTIVRNDIEEPFETIIKLDNGRYLNGNECQYSYCDVEKIFVNEEGTDIEKFRNLFNDLKISFTIYEENNGNIVFSISKSSLETSYTSTRNDEIVELVFDENGNFKYFCGHGE